MESLDINAVELEKISKITLRKVIENDKWIGSRRNV